MTRGTSARPPPNERVVSFPTPQDAADYIAALLRQLGQMATQHDMPMLAYFIDMAEIEAARTAEGVAEPRTYRDH